MIEKIILEKELIKGNSIRKIARDNKIHYKTLQYWTKKWNLISSYNKPNYNELYFSNIDTKIKAYILGFLLADSSLNNKTLEISLQLNDEQFLKLLLEEIGSNITKDLTLNKKQKRFPRCRTSISNKHILKDIKKLFGGQLKKDRHIPIISKLLQTSLLLGFFDGDGCITYGIRKDRKSFWGKVYFTSQLKMLEGIQKILENLNISSSIKPRKKENCFDLYIKTKDMFKLVEIFDNLNIPSLQRKRNKINALLRPESDELGKTIKQYRTKLSEREGVETTGSCSDTT